LTHGWLHGEKELMRGLLAASVPTLGVCLGAQLAAEVAGGSVARMTEPEIGWLPTELTPEARVDPLLGSLPETFESFQWHSCEIAAPAGARVLACSAACIQAFRLDRAPWWGIQFHAEATSATIAGWVADYRSDDDAVHAQLDWEALLTETERQIGYWNELGAGICMRFLHRAAEIARS
jgi:GMP synthase-like glutamine amidotransferase